MRLAEPAESSEVICNISETCAEMALKPFFVLHAPQQKLHGAVVGVGCPRAFAAVDAEAVELPFHLAGACIALGRIALYRLMQDGPYDGVHWRAIDLRQGPACWT